VIGVHLHALWNDLWPNTVAPSAWTLAAVIIGYVRTARRQRRHLEEAKATRQIAADLHLHVTGEAHPEAPRREGEAK